MRVVFAGTPDVALPSLEAFQDAGHDLALVVTRPDAPAGRRRVLTPSPVAQWAEERGIPTLRTSRPHDPAALEAIAAARADVGAVVAYGALLRPSVLAALPFGWANLHFSVLPAWRGAAPVQRALMAGDEVTGASVFLLDEGLDTGPVLGTLTEVIRAEDTSGDLLGRLAETGAGLLVRALEGHLSGTVVGVTQAGEPSYAPKLDRDDARVRWYEPGFAVDRRVRGVTPDPGAWTTFRGDRLRLWPVTVRREETTLRPGEIRVEPRDVVVGTGTSAVVLGDVAVAGRARMRATDWARGARITEGEELS